MDLAPEDIRNFIEMVQREFGETLTPETAESQAKRLIDFFITLAEERRMLEAPAARGIPTQLLPDLDDPQEFADRSHHDPLAPSSLH